MSGQAANNHGAFIWSVADLLRGVYKQSEYGRVILPLTVLRRSGLCARADQGQCAGDEPPSFPRAWRTGPRSWRTPRGSRSITRRSTVSRRCLPTRTTWPGICATTLRGSPSRPATSSTSSTSTLRSTVWPITTCCIWWFRSSPTSICVPTTVSNLEMGYIYEELIRRFSELSNETAGEHFTPREVIRLMVNLLFVDDDDLLTKPGIVKTMLDPACGTGGMLSVSEEYLRNLNPQGRLEVYGQEVNAETYATCRADMLIKGQNASRIRFGNSFDNDQHPNRRFDYLLANPPFGVEWKMVADTRQIRTQDQRPFAGRFGAGTPRINDGSFLFLQHMISKMRRPDEGGARLAIVFNGSPLFTGAAGSGESEIRRVDHRERLARSRSRPPRPAVLQHRHLHLLLGGHKPQEHRSGAARYNSSTPATRGPRCEKASATNANRPAKNRSPNSPASTARSKKAPGSRSSQTKASDSYASPSNAPSSSAGRSPTTPSGPSQPIRRSPSSHPSCKNYSSTNSAANRGATYRTEKTAKAVVRGRPQSRSSARNQHRWSTQSPTLSQYATPTLQPSPPKANPKPDPTLRDYENGVPPVAGHFHKERV